jgi:predicted secreted Zn-dependent protease
MKFVVICFSMFSAFSYSDVILREHFEHYIIAPERVEQIKFELRAHSPVSRKNQVFHGGTEWTLVPDFRWKQIGNLCKIQDVRVTLDGIYTLPKLKNDLVVGADIKKRFEQYYEALLEHEKGHQDLWLSAGQEIETLLKNFEPFYSCAELAKQAKIRVGQVIHDYQQHNRNYDKQTGHGKTQGAAIK